MKGGQGIWGPKFLSIAYHHRQSTHRHINMWRPVLKASVFSGVVSSFHPSFVPTRATIAGSRMRHGRSDATRSTYFSRQISDIDSFSDEGGEIRFERGKEVRVEVTKFGPLGASVDIIGLGHTDNDGGYMVAIEDPPLGRGLILQSEIGYFRRERGGLDVVIGEVLPAYVDDIRREDGKVDIGLRPPGGKAKSTELSSRIMERLKSLSADSGDGSLPIGDKSTPEDINAEFPGASKGAFKKAVASLYKRRLIQKPEPHSIKLL